MTLIVLSMENITLNKEINEVMNWKMDTKGEGMGMTK